MVLLAAALAAYFTGLDEPWWLVPLLLLAPDLFMVGYARSHRAGAWLYNLAHSYPVPAVLGGVALAADRPFWQGVALVWFAHHRHGPRPGLRAEVRDRLQGHPPRPHRRVTPALPA